MSHLNIKSDDTDNKKNEHDENNTNAENKETDRRVSQSETKITINIDEYSTNNVQAKKSELPVQDDVVIDLKRDVFDAVISKNNELLHDKKTFLKKCESADIREPSQYLRRNMKIWVQYSFGHGRGTGSGSLDYGPDRNSFILLVMSIVLIMLLITAAWIILVFKVQSLYDIFKQPSIAIFIVAIVGLLMLHYAMMCIRPAREAPCGFFMLVLTVIFMGLLAAVITCRFNTEIVIYAVFATAGVVLMCSALACTSFDFTSFLLYFIVIATAFSVVALCVFIGMMITGTYMKSLHIVILFGSLLLQSIALVMVLQMILGGRSVAIEEEEYPFAAFAVYTSIMQIFLDLVQILGLLDS